MVAWMKLLRRFSLQVMAWQRKQPKPPTSKEGLQASANVSTPQSNYPTLLAYMAMEMRGRKILAPLLVVYTLLVLPIRLNCHHQHCFTIIINIIISIIWPYLHNCHNFNCNKTLTPTAHR